MDSRSNLELEDWTPLHTRIIAHRIGDGTVNFYGRAVYDNKHITEFVSLLKKLNINFWKPNQCKKWGTYKIIIPGCLFEKFGQIYKIDPKKLIYDPLYLLNNLAQLPKEHKLQAILAFIVDDGSCKSWRMTVFEDQHKEIVFKVSEIWDSLFQGTSKISFMVTKRGTRVYHLHSNRDGIIQLYGGIKDSVKKYGPLADLWWKQKDLEERYQKAVSKRGTQLNDTLKSGEQRNEEIINYIKENGFITLPITMRILRLSQDRARRTLLKLVNGGSIYLTKAGSRSRYTLKKEDISYFYRKNLIFEFINKRGFIQNRDARMIFNLKINQTYKILKKMCGDRLLKQIKEKGTTKYILPVG